MSDQDIRFDPLLAMEYEITCATRDKARDGEKLKAELDARRKVGDRMAELLAGLPDSWMKDFDDSIQGVLNMWNSIQREDNSSTGGAA